MDGMNIINQGGEDMTHDELVQFASEKVGVSIIIRSVCAQTIGDEDIFERRWFYQEPDGFCDEPFDLTSPDLFFKGLAVCQDKVLVSVGHEAHEKYVSVLPTEGRFSMKWYDKPNEIPQKFWESWAETSAKGSYEK